MKRGDAGERLDALRERARSARVVIFHDATDEVVPLSDSRQLAEGAAMDLRVVEAGGHRLGGLLTGGALADTVRRLVDASAT